MGASHLGGLDFCSCTPTSTSAYVLFFFTYLFISSSRRGGLWDMPPSLPPLEFPYCCVSGCGYRAASPAPGWGGLKDPAGWMDDLIWDRFKVTWWSLFATVQWSFQSADLYWMDLIWDRFKMLWRSLFATVQWSFRSADPFCKYPMNLENQRLAQPWRKE